VSYTRITRVPWKTQRSGRSGPSAGQSGVDDPREMERLAKTVEDVAHRRWLVSNNPDEHLEQLRPYLELGFNHSSSSAGQDRLASEALRRANPPRLRNRWGGLAMTTWVVVLIKDFSFANSVYNPRLWTRGRGRPCAAQRAACGECGRSRRPGACRRGSYEVAELAATWGADVLLEPSQDGQNVAAARASRRVEGALTLCCSYRATCPGHHRGRARSHRSASRLDSPVAMASRPPGGRYQALYFVLRARSTLHFGSDSLAKFRRAEAREVNFVVHHSEALAFGPR